MSPPPQSRSRPSYHPSIASAHASHTPLPPCPLRYENKLVKRALRATPSSLLLSALHPDLSDLEAEIAPGLAAAGATGWAATRQGWQERLGAAESAEAVAELLLELEAAVRGLQQVGTERNKRVGLKNRTGLQK